MTERTAAAGLERYEVSAYARPGTAASTTSTTGSLATTSASAPGRTASSPSRTGCVRQVRWREPACYMAQAGQGQAVSNDNEVPRKELPFEFVLNAFAAEGRRAARELLL